jgi:hypothetical protein
VNTSVTAAEGCAFCSDDAAGQAIIGINVDHFQPDRTINGSRFQDLKSLRARLIVRRHFGR